MGVHFLNAQGGPGLNPQHIQRKIGPKKGIVNRGEFVNVQTAHLPWAAQAADEAWLEADWRLIAFGSLFTSLGERKSLRKSRYPRELFSFPLSIRDC